MKNIEMMKQYIRENNLTGQVRELVNGADMDSEDAIEYVYDAHVMSKKDFAVLPIESETVEQLVTAGITTVAALVAWWKNNSFTHAALEGDKTYDRVKKSGY